jgi:hypothetical protein
VIDIKSRLFLTICITICLLIVLSGCRDKTTPTITSDKTTELLSDDTLVNQTIDDQMINDQPIVNPSIETPPTENQPIENQPTKEFVQFSHPFPRLGMWWLGPYETFTSDMAKYDLLLDSFDDDYLQERLYEVKQYNPDQINLKPLSPTERQLFLHDWEKDIDYPNPEVTRLPADFFLLQTGTYLAKDITTK